MIGQADLLLEIDKLIEKKFPRFVVITGEKGQGKKTISKEIANKLNYPLVDIGIKVDEIRQMIETAYKQTEPIIYLISDADKMSVGAKNAILKVIEEPPNNAYFIMTLRTMNNTLGTIRSRCIELKMNNYSVEEISQFIDKIEPGINDFSDDERACILDICQNYYQIDLLIKYGVKEFYNYVEKVVDNIYKVQSANAFKLAEKIALKDEEDKYDIKLFLETYKNICINRVYNLLDTDNDLEYLCYIESILKTNDIINKLSVTGINKQSLIDIWILDIRKIWRDN